ncbi:MFS transporter [Thalassovita taeanensis]|uniref:Predicted arabinose efflux permease, MFS family n=1 Tax=Thalassovita taeanensis TaxID=657014 RepID=A0A1H8YUX6_9RHOB|nr:MFS transporter [Thalassovita taeanensis]SEP55178.1 Predicted arabinose efflux permease, MFS family [Thalassovita taeanensis]
MKLSWDSSALKRLPRGVWALGFVSLWMDISSEMIHALLPVYLVTVMGSSMVAVGFIEGIAEATAAITKVFSGALSDWLGRRKVLVVVGYGLAALTKPIFPLAPTLGWVVGARFIDRVGKGIRGAPRDALLADLAPEELRGASFGLRQSLDTVGAFIGPLLAIGLMWALAGDIRLVFWAAVIPAVIAVWLLVTQVREPEREGGPARVKAPLSWAAARKLGGVYWAVVAVAAAFTLARFSEAFLVLKAHDDGLTVALVPVVLVVMNVAYALSAYPAGAMSDEKGGSRIKSLAVGVALLVVADLVLALVPGLPGVWLGVVLWGVHMGFTQGAFSALVADTAPVELRGTGFGMLNLMTGGAILLASVIAGVLWDGWGAQGTFLGGATLAFVALLSLWPLRRVMRKNSAAIAEEAGQA